MWNALRDQGLSIPPPAVLQDDAALGATEIIITIIATAATRALISVALHQIEKYVAGKILEPIDMQVLVKGPEGTTNQTFPLRLRNATVAVIHSFFDNIEKAIS
jgi:hypothetical protein